MTFRPARESLSAGLGLLVLSSFVQPIEAAKPDRDHPGNYPLVESVVDGATRAVDTRTGHVRALYRLDLRVAPGSPEAMAREALAALATDLRLSAMPGSLVLRSIADSPGAHHVRFEQVVSGVPVFRGEIVVSIGKATGRVSTVQSNIAFDAPSAVGSPAIPSGAALETARRHLALTGRVIGAERVDLRIREGRLVWMASVPNTEPAGDWVVVVDASTGSVRDAYDQAVYADGSGLAFDPDPLTTAEAAYGSGGFIDNNDADSDDLNGERFPVVLPDLLQSAGRYWLEGPHCSIQDFESPFDGTTSEVDPGAFVYSRFQQGFEDVVVYHHIDKSQRHIQSLGFTNIQNNSIWCDPHGLSGADNSHYLPSSNRIAWGEGCVDDAEDVDVVLHEYGHAIQHGTVPGWGGGQEGAMGEGFGDYWAGSYSATVNDFNSTWIFGWDGHNECWQGRFLDRDWFYPDDLTGQVHHDGEIWSAGLWKVWNEIGREPTDFLVLAHHFYLGTSASMPQAAQAMVQADIDNNGGLNMDTLVAWFVHRGFFEAQDWPLPGIVHNALGNQPGTGPFTINATVIGGSPVAEVRLVYGIDGVAAGSVAMTPSGPATYTGTIPDQGDGTVQYYIAAETTSGLVATHPRPAPSEWHTFTTGVVAVSPVEGAAITRLIGASPNPFHPATRVRFSVASTGDVSLRIYDSGGRLVRTLLEEPLVAGAYEAGWDGRDHAGRVLPASVYFVRMEAAGGYRSDERIVLVK